MRFAALQLAWVLLTTVPILSAAAAEAPIARILAVVTEEGALAEAVVQRSGEKFEATAQMDLFEGDEVSTGPATKLRILFLRGVVEEDNEILLDAGATVEVRSPDSILLKLGRLFAQVRGYFDVGMRNTVLGAVGTEFQAEAFPESPEDGSLFTFVGDVAVYSFSLDEVSQPGASRFDIRCLDCAGTTCSQTRSSYVVRLQVDPAVTVAPLRSVDLGEGNGMLSSRDLAIDEAWEAIEWTTKAIVETHPAIPGWGSYPSFASEEERVRSFARARFRALWKQDAEAFETVAGVYADWQQGSRAVDALRQAARLDAGRVQDPGYLLLLGRSERLAGDLAAALSTLSRAQALGARRTEVANELGLVQFDLGRRFEEVGDQPKAFDALTTAELLFAEGAAGLESPSTDMLARSRSNLDRTTQHIQALRPVKREASPQIEDRPVDEGGAHQSPPSIVRGIPDLKGVAESLARDRLARTGFTVGLVTRRPSRQPKGTVVDQYPQPGAKRFTGSAVDFVLAVPEGGVAVPDVVGRDLDAAVDSLKDAGFDYEIRAEKSGRTARTVLGQSPRPGKERPYGSAVELRVAVAKKNVEKPVPDVVGFAIETAIRVLEESGFSFREKFEKESVEAVGVVVEQIPRAAALRPLGTSVDLTVAVPIRVTVPRFLGMRAEQAPSKAGRLGLRLAPFQRHADCRSIGIVIGQVPVAGTRLPSDSRIQLTLGDSGGSPSEVPDLLEMNQGAAERTLLAARLRLGRVEWSESEKAPETVIEQNPPQRTLLPPGCTVDVEIAVPRSDVRVPDLIGKTLDDARRLLGDSLRLGDIRYKEEIGEDVVIEQSPQPGERIRKGMWVDLVIRRNPRISLVPRMGSRPSGLASPGGGGP